MSFERLNEQEREALAQFVASFRVDPRFGGSLRERGSDGPYTGEW
jgi:hypothetical protein